MSSRALGLVKEALNRAGMEISHAWEDLVFPEHTGFLLQFCTKENELFIHTNKEANAQELEWPISLLQLKGKEVGLRFHKGQRYTLSDIDTENFRLEFCRT